MSAVGAPAEEESQPEKEVVRPEPLTQAPFEDSHTVEVEGQLPESASYHDQAEAAEQGHPAPPHGQASSTHRAAHLR